MYGRKYNFSTTKTCRYGDCCASSLVDPPTLPRSLSSPIVFLHRTHRSLSGLWRTKAIARECVLFLLLIRCYISCRRCMNFTLFCLGHVERYSPVWPAIAPRVKSSHSPVREIVRYECARTCMCEISVCYECQITYRENIIIYLRFERRFIWIELNRNTFTYVGCAPCVCMCRCTRNRVCARRVHRSLLSSAQYVSALIIN